MNSICIKVAVATATERVYHGIANPVKPLLGYDINNTQ